MNNEDEKDAMQADEEQEFQIPEVPYPVRNPHQFYTLDRTLRDTIYGKVKLGMVNQNRIPVAIKLSDLQRIQQNNILEDPEQECKVMGYLSSLNNGQGHRHIIKLLDVQNDGVYHWTVLELCPGGEFFDIIANNGRLAEDVAKKYFRQLMEAVLFMHQAGVCHLDLSLENLLLGAPPQRDLKICDFGMARAIPREGMFQPGAHRPGKTNYMAPEIFALRPFSATKSDIYSCGVILFIMLTGTPPYQIPSDQDARFRLIFGGRLRVLLEKWGFVGRISELAIDLVQKLLCPENHRLSIADILNHPWLR